MYYYCGELCFAWTTSYMITFIIVTKKIILTCHTSFIQNDFARSIDRIGLINVCFNFQCQICENPSCGIKIHNPCVARYFKGRSEPRCPACDDFWPHEIPGNYCLFTDEVPFSAAYCFYFMIQMNAWKRSFHHYKYVALSGFFLLFYFSILHSKSGLL